VAKAPARKKKGSGSSRRNYATPVEATGWRRFTPTGWANWLGLILFGIIFVALCVETVQATIEGRGADPVAALAVTIGFGWMVYLFATTRVKDV
jgi:hypothetical protein